MTELVGQVPQIQESLFIDFRDYNWDADEGYQAGKKSVLAAKGLQSMDSEGELRLRAFFFSRKFGVDINVDAYTKWLEENASKLETREATADQGPDKKDDNVPYSASYAQVVEMILSGKPIPGIRDIPDTELGLQQSSQTSAQRRRKPWETEPVQEEKKPAEENEKDQFKDGADQGEGVPEETRP